MKKNIEMKRILTVFSVAAALAACGKAPQEGPCDIYEKYGTPCVAAHSTTRLLSSKYDEPLYRIRRESDGAVMDIMPDRYGYADAAAQDAFSKGTISFIIRIYDQSGYGNDLMQAAPGTFKGPAEGEFNTAPIADMAPVTINGRKAYGAFIMPGMGFRNNNASFLAINDEPEGMYYVIDGTHYDSGCCFDYGNSSTNGRAVGRGTMETTYYGTSTAWGRGNGEGPWIMADMEAGLFSGYDPKHNDVPSIDGWRFVSVFLNGGGGNQWDLRGGDATTDSLTTFYSGVRPPSDDEKENYYPMSKKGAILLGNGGDNGNGSAGTFYEGVMTIGYPTDEAIAAVQANIAAQNYKEPPMWMSRITTFSPGEPQDLTVTFNNTTGNAVKGLEVFLNMPSGWETEKTDEAMTDKSIEPEGRASVTFRITPSGQSSGFIQATASWKGGRESQEIRARCASAVRINEIGLTGEQFIELFNPSGEPVDLSGCRLEITRSGWAAADAAEFPEGTEIKPGGFLLLRPSEEAVAADERTLTTIFTPVSTGPWLSVPAGSDVIPYTAATGFAEGNELGIGLGGKFEKTNIVSVGTPGTQTVTIDPLKSGDKVIRLEGTEYLEEGSELTIGTGQRIEKVKVKKVLKVSKVPVRQFGIMLEPQEPGEVELETPITIDQIRGVDVSCPGTGLKVSPALKYPHISGEALEDRPVDHLCKDGLHFGMTVSTKAGAVALYKDGILIDAVVYGSRQSNSSGNGTIARPDLATLEGVQTQGGCIAVVPSPYGEFNFRRGGPMPEIKSTSLVRKPDGNDTDNLCKDFTGSYTPTPGEKNL